MKEQTKLLVVPSTFLDAIEKLLRTAPPPTTAKDKADRATAKRIIESTRKRRVEVLDENDLRRMAAKARKARARKRKKGPLAF